MHGGLPETAQVRPYLGSRPPKALRPSWDSPGEASPGIKTSTFRTFRAFGGLSMLGGLPGSAQVRPNLLKASIFRIFRAFGDLQMFGGLPGTAQVRPPLGSMPPNLGFSVNLEASECLEAFLA